MKKIFVAMSLLFSLAITSANAVEVTPEEKITGLYVAYFDRAADQEGLKYWTDKAVEVAQAGGDESAVFITLSEGFATHPTFTETYDHLNNEEFVALIYQNALGRDGDAEGIAYWTDLLDRGIMLRPEMVATFVELSLVTDLTKENYPNLSDEELAAAQLRQDLITNKVDASLMFTKQLGTFSNVVDSQDPEEDPAYLASIKIISEITEDPETVSTVKYFLDYMDDSTEVSEQIAFINTYFPDFPDLVGPVFTSDPNMSIDENTAYVTILTATDASRPIKFELLSYIDGSKFKLNEGNQLMFIVAPDFEAYASSQNDNEYKVGVKSIDALGNFSTQTMTVTVNNTDAPGFTSSPNVTVNEDDIKVTIISAQGEDPAGTLTFSITGGEDQSLFDLDLASGLLSFKNAPDFENPLDADKNNVYKVEITATEGSASVIQQLKITVKDLGEASLEIISAVYDDKGTTGATADDSLLVYFDRQIDDNSWSTPEFDLTGTASTSGATFEYTNDSPYKLSVTNGLSGFVPNTTNINVAANGFTVGGETVQAGTPVSVTARQVIVASGDGDFTRDNSTEIVTDNNTKLEWQDNNDTKSSDKTKTWYEAEAYCLDLGDGWRLPNTNELINLTDKSIGTGSESAIDPVFVNIRNYYWSSTAYIADLERAWIVSFDYGKNDHVLKSSSLNVRCVRGIEQTERTFIRDSINIVHDINSGLLWDDTVRTQGDADLTWNEAKIACENNTLGGYTWRVPNFNELQSTVDYNKIKPSIYNDFENTYVEGHWTSTEDSNITSNKAWSIRFSGGESILEDKDLHDNKQFVRCVTDAL